MNRSISLLLVATATTGFAGARPSLAQVGPPRVLVFQEALRGTEAVSLRWPLAVAAASDEEVTVADAFGPRLLRFRKVGVSWQLDRSVAIAGAPAGLVWDGRRYVAARSTIETRRMTRDEFIDMIKTDDEFAKKWGELGRIYGKQWRSWSTYPSDYLTNPIDQIANLISELKTNPDSRRLMVSAWNVGELDQMVLPPCHYGFQVYTRELSLEERRKLAKCDSEFVSPMTVESWDRNNIPTRAISLMWNQRSVDTPLGLPFNIASYGLLLEIIAKMVNMVPDELIGKEKKDFHFITMEFLHI